MQVAVSELQAKNEILQRQTMSLKEEHSLQKHKIEELCKVPITENYLYSKILLHFKR